LSSVMQPKARQQIPRTTLDYFDPSPGQRARRGILLRTLAGTLAVVAGASAANAWRNHWGLNWVCVLAVVAAGVLAARATGRHLLIPLRSVWALAAAVFGLWSLILFTNQFHGRPPPSDVYFISGWATACVLSVVGLSFDKRRTGAA
jgi:hypothetical protein